jgi:hypothetical protein
MRREVHGPTRTTLAEDLRRNDPDSQVNGRSVKLGKSSLIPILKDHFRTLVDASSGKISWRDVTEQFGLPAVAAIVSLVTGWYWRNPSGAIAGVAIVAALLCSMAVFIFQLRLETYQINDERLGPRDYELLDETFHNVMWAIVVGLALALYLIACDALGLLKNDTTGKVLTALAVFTSAHFLMVIGMSLKRLRRAYERIAARKR